MVTTRRKAKLSTREAALKSGRLPENNTTDGSGDNVVEEPVEIKPKAAKGEISFTRKCLGSLKYLALMIAIPPFLNYAALNQEGQKLIPEGALYDVGFGHKLFMSCMGKGVPTVILDAPTGSSSDVWGLIQPELAKTTRVCVYDRAGLGFSERPPQNHSSASVSHKSGDVDESNESDEIKPDNEFKRNKWQEFTVERMADDLHNLITYSSQQSRPLIMVGAEMGALVTRFYSQLYETDVSDVVLIDPLVEDLFTHDEAVWAPYWARHLIPSFQTMQVSAAVGLTRLALILGLLDPPMVNDNINQLEGFQGRQKHLLCHPKHLSSVVDEHHFVNDSFSQIQTLFMMKRFPSNISVTVINGNYYDEQLPSALNKAWAKSQQNLVSKLHPGSNHILVNGADRHMLYRKPSAVVDPVKRLVKQWRTKNKNKDINTKAI